MNLIDRLLTIVITATLTSALWIVAGGSLIANSTDESQRDVTRPAEAAPSPSPAANAGLVPDLDRAEAPNLETITPGLAGEARETALMIPVLNIRAGDLSDTFTNSRGGGTRFHEAIDIMAPEGTSVVAAAPGTIEKLFVSDAGGNTIYVRSADRKTIYYYAHLSEYAEGLQEGQRIRRGQRLGSVGSTGNASRDAPHLHFAMMRTTPEALWWEPATAVNPYRRLTGG